MSEQTFGAECAEEIYSNRHLTGINKDTYDIEAIAKIINDQLARRQPAPEPVAGEWTVKETDYTTHLDFGGTEYLSMSKDFAGILYKVRDAHNAALRQANAEIIRCKALVVERDAWLPQEERTKLETELSRCRDALQLLYDFQNGCPLPKYEAGWNKAMAMAQAILFPASF